MSLEDDMLKLNEKIEKIIKMSEKNIAKNYKKTLEDLRTSIRKLYDKYEKDGTLTLTEMSKYDRIKKFENDIKFSISSLYKNNDILINATLKNVFVTTLDNTVDSVSKNSNKPSLSGIKKELDIDATVNEEMAGLHWANRTKHHRNNVIYEINSTLRQGLSQGSTYKELSDRLKDKLNGDVLKPMRIVRTEGARVYASTQKQSLDRIASSGLKMVKKWVSAKDERVRAMHKLMDGKVVDYDKDFELPDGVKTSAPHLSGYAHHDIHCRCIMTVDLKENFVNNLSIPNINEPNLKNSYDDLDKILSRKAKVNEHANRMSMYMQMTEYVEDENFAAPFSYSMDEDIIKYNPKHPDYYYYNLNYTQVHEISHRMDILQYDSVNNKDFANSIEKSKDVFYNNEEQIKKWFNDKDGIYADDGAVSDIMSALSMSKANDYVPYAHEKEYWKREGTVVREVFANLSSIDILDDGFYKEFKSLFGDLFNSYLGVVK